MHSQLTQRLHMTIKNLLTISTIIIFGIGMLFLSETSQMKIISLSPSQFSSHFAATAFADINPQVLASSLRAYRHAVSKGITTNPLLTIVDYSKSSTDKRLWVIDTRTNKVLFNTWVAHGKNSGDAASTEFSNKPESLKSSIGVFVTEETYTGKHGDSLRVQGLEPGFNNNAYRRSIVFHGAKYVSAKIASTGKLGHSWGCFAVSQKVINSLVKTIKNKVLVVAYYPDKGWLKSSNFLR